MKVVAIIQARMGSTRLPGKVLLPLGDKTVLAHVVNKLQEVEGIHAIVVATSDLIPDIAIEIEANKLQVPCYRGSETNVLERYYLAAKMYDADIVIRITADCPFIDASVLRQMLELFLAHHQSDNQIDYLSNALIRTFPRGLDAEIFTMQALQKTYKEAALDYQLEHVTPYIYQNPNLFSLRNFENPEDLSQYRLTLDTKEDMELLTTLHRLLNEANGNKLAPMTTSAIIDLLKQHPWLAAINQHVQQKPLPCQVA